MSSLSDPASINTQYQHVDNIIKSSKKRNVVADDIVIEAGVIAELSGVRDWMLCLSQIILHTWILIDSLFG